MALSIVGWGYKLYCNIWYCYSQYNPTGVDYNPTEKPGIPAHFPAEHHQKFPGT